jgi:hypothetical protein
MMLLRWLHEAEDTNRIWKEKTHTYTHRQTHRTSNWLVDEERKRGREMAGLWLLVDVCVYVIDIV